MRTRRRFGLMVLMFGVLAAAGCSSVPAAGPQLTVRTSSGTLQGLATASTREFLGVRYALPPTGNRRWTDPQPEPAAPGVVQATKPGPACAQGGGTAAATEKSTSEDCLFLNVTTPKDATAGQRLPVMVWWHGGGYTSGAGADYDARRLASRGHVIILTVNYRLGAFGYFGLPGLAGSGDFGFADQIAATKWAKANAAAFGGDPDNLTVFGESAGGMSACALLTSPQAVGLVQRVAISSGSCLLNWPAGGLFPGTPPATPYTPVTVDQADGTAAATMLGCTGPDALACMRAKPVKDLLLLATDFADHLSYGTPLLPQNPADAVRAGHVAHVPVLASGNQGEARAFMGGAAMADPKLITAQTYPALVATAFGGHAASVLARYPLTKYPTPVDAFATVITDDAWACQTLAGEQAMSTVTTVYPMEFAEPNPPNINHMSVPGFTPGPGHATDLPYLFDLGGTNLLTGAQARLGDELVDLYASFARTGTPTIGRVHVGTATPTGTTTLSLTAAALSPTDVSAEHQCDFWATQHG